MRTGDETRTNKQDPWKNNNNTSSSPNSHSQFVNFDPFEFERLFVVAFVDINRLINSEFNFRDLHLWPFSGQIYCKIKSGHNKRKRGETQKPIGWVLDGLKFCLMGIWVFFLDSLPDLTFDLKGQISSADGAANRTSQDPGLFVPNWGCYSTDKQTNKQTNKPKKKKEKLEALERQI